MFKRPFPGRSLEELLETKDILKGVESQRLRSYCTSNCMEPNRDLDDYGLLLQEGDLELVNHDFNERISRFQDTGLSDSLARSAAIDELYTMRWGPTRVPIYNLLLLFSAIFPRQRMDYIYITSWLVTTAKVPVNGTDASGTTALSHSISTKPQFDVAFAQLLHDAGGDVNNRNRYGGTCGHEIIQIWNRDPETVERATEAFDWFLTHGGNVDVKEGDGLTVRFMAGRIIQGFGAGIGKGFRDALAKEDKRRKEREQFCCGFCGREDAATLMRCGRCKKINYCSPTYKDRACQKLDWPRHKPTCKA